MDVLNGGSKAVALTILTGFLGAGKTTLLNRILTGDHGLRIGVLVNDFGSINIDADLVVGVDDNMISLANGCVCCQIRDDLVDAVLTLLTRQKAVDYILLEASGVADPSGIFATFNDPSLRDRIRLDGIVCVVDADQVFAHPKYPPLLELKLRQIGFADMLILNKVDLAGPEQVEKVRAWLDGHFNRLRVVEANHCEVPYPIFLGVGRFDHAQAALDSHHAGHQQTHPASLDPHQPDDGHTEEHADAFSTWSYETDRPLSLKALRESMRQLPGTLYRVKGIVYTSDSPGLQAVLQVVGRRVDISLTQAWGQQPPRTRIVAIGAYGGIDATLLEQAFASCIAPAPTGDQRLAGTFSDADHAKSCPSAR